MASITSANAILTLAIPPLFPTPQQLQQFAADDVYGVDQIKSVETMMGVDGVMTAGFVFVEVKQTIHLMADSPSCFVFDTWWSQMQAAEDVFYAFGLIVLPAVLTKFVQTRGALTGYSPVPAAKKVLQPRAFEITWNRVQPQPSA